MADWWTKSKWVEQQPQSGAKKPTTIVLEALSGKPVSTGNKRKDEKNLEEHELKPKPKVPDDKTAAVEHYKAMLRLLQNTTPGGDRTKPKSAAQLQATATQHLSVSWNEAIALGDDDIYALLCGADKLGIATSPDEIDAWIGKIDKRLGAVADVDEWNYLVGLVETPLLLREIKTRRAPVAAAAASASAEEDAAPTRNTRSTTCKPFHSLLSVGLVVTSYNRDQWDGVVLAMDNAKFYASEARAMMERADGAGNAEEASAHYETYKQHMNTLKQLEVRALPGLGAFLAEPVLEPVLGKRGRDETDDDEEEEDTAPLAEETATAPV